MKALSLTQPWATLVAIGAKRIETRSWPTYYTGPLAIHASMGFPSWAKELTLEEEAFKSALSRAGIKSLAELPRGAVIATCTLTACWQFGHTNYRVEGLIGGGWISEPERSFGDFSTGRYGFLLSDVVRLPTPIPAKGGLGLWNWER